MGIDVLPPNVKASRRYFHAVGGSVLYGLQGIKHIGSATDAIIAAREKAPEMDRLLDFLKAVDMERVNKKAVESLIKSGALDIFEPNRAKHMAVFESMIDRIKDDRKHINMGQTSLFDMDPDIMKEADINISLPEVEDFSNKQKLNWEKEYVGIYLSGHPLDDHKWVIDCLEQRESTFCTTDTLSTSIDDSEINAEVMAHPVNDGAQVCVAGVIDGVRTLITRKNDTMAFLQVEDIYGTVEVIVFADCYEKSSEFINEDSVVVVRGKISLKEGEDPKIVASKITPIDIAEQYFRHRDEKGN
jgi:DNA polymerase-3 subunit alpha